MSRGPLVLGGLGHALCRLTPARAAARSWRFDVKEVLYPGFEGRAPSPDLETFLDEVEHQVDIYRLSHKHRLVYATGFGTLVALALRARGRFAEVPFLFQGSVPWLTVKRIGGAPELGAAIRASLRRPDVQERYVARHFLRALSDDESRSFFSGWATCDIHEQLFEWVTPGWLADLEGRLAARPRMLEGIVVWTGAQDGLVQERELEATQRALGVEWPRVDVDGWGHFPYLDDPVGWVEAIGRTLG